MCNEPFSKGGLRSLGFRVWVLVSGFSRRGLGFFGFGLRFQVVGLGSGVLDSGSGG